MIPPEIDNDLGTATDSIASPDAISPVTIAGICIALFGLLLTVPFEMVTGLSLSGAEVAVYKWVLGVLLCLIVLVGEGKSLASIGFRWPTRWDVAIAIGLFLVMMISIVVMQAILWQLGVIESNGGTPADNPALFWPLFIAATAGITEEVLYRGYALERLEAITTSTWLAATVTAVAFVLIHFGGGPVGILISVPAALLLTGVYVWRRNIYVVIAAHVAVNCVPLVLMTIS